MEFNPNTISEFRFLSTSFADNTVKLNYALDDRFFFTESFTFPHAFSSNWKYDTDALQIAINLLHLAAGVSYYKLAVPSKISIENQVLSIDVAKFFSNLYLNGLGEFSYKNNLSLKERINFPYQNNAPIKSTNLSLPRLTAVPLGGGKDSLVTLEALQKAEEPLTAIALGDYQLIKDVAKCANLQLPLIKRQLDPQLKNLNQAGAYNGHVPISSIIVFTLTTAAILCGFDTIAISQERSANIPNLVFNGLEINHQFSKSFEFELALNKLLRLHFPNLNYFSFLRPLSELGICHLFARHCQKYFYTFSSCNRSFSSTHPLENGKKWCCNCPKCRFIFLSLAPFIDKNTLISIFGTNLLDDSSQLQGYLELLGETGHKPFECVGEIEESRMALAMLNQEWQNCLVIQRLKDKIKYWEDVAILKPSKHHNIPKRFEEILFKIMK